MPTAAATSLLVPAGTGLLMFATAAATTILGTAVDLRSRAAARRNR